MPVRLLPALALASGGHVVVAVAANRRRGGRLLRRLRRRPGRAWGRRALVAPARAGAAAVGGAEVRAGRAVNTVVVRPVAMYVALGLLDGVVLEVVTGKLSPTWVFLAVTAVSYELSTRRRPAPPTKVAETPADAADHIETADAADADTVQD